MSGPFSGLFGGGTPAANAESLSLRGSLFGVQQNVNVPTDVDPALLDPRFQQSGRFAGASSSMDYSFRRSAEQSAFSFGANGSLSDYSISPTEPQYGFGANAGLSTKLTRRITFSGSGQAFYSSTYNLNPGVPGLGDTGLLPAGGFAVLPLANVNSSADINLSAALSQRSTLSAGLYTRRTWYPEDPFFDFSSLGSSASFSYRIFRRLNFRATYRRERTSFGSGVKSEPVQSVDFALDYGDALTLRLSRRTTLSLSVSAGSYRALNGQTQYRLLGGATLSHTRGRTWIASLGYNRSLGFVSAFYEPTLEDRVFASLGGQIKPRISLIGSADLRRGYVGLDTSKSYDAYSAYTTLSFALARRVSGFAQYLYYGNRTPENISTLPLLSDYSRRAAVVGLSLWAPLYNKPRVRQ